MKLHLRNGARMSGSSDFAVDGFTTIPALFEEPDLQAIEKQVQRAARAAAEQLAADHPTKDRSRSMCAVAMQRRWTTVCSMERIRTAAFHGATRCCFPSRQIGAFFPNPFARISQCIRPCQTLLNGPPSPSGEKESSHDTTARRRPCKSIEWRHRILVKGL
ncbi:hypothetical protein OZ411_01860 [Bradyrhizobium sp. Arg237L]|uniref:hypothetical protein n=1 Tax=Bradyrhizobium sp. Arg237L TaxID=3003352 RepID=UPI00249EE5F0|nr:hypothetical protein [Bradyrhizobium sp. Arg237L]MDI4231558.1 hypothetical protein [Bradyrhizobium sp. Arg237L]